MSTRLVILGFLRERPLYGYEIKSLIEEQMGDWTNIAFGSIYFALGKLADEGFIEKVATEQSGNRPSRSIYQIRPEGRAEFLRLLREMWREDDRQYFPFDIALFYIHALPKEEVLVYLQKRVEGLERATVFVDAHQANTFSNPDVPLIADAIFEHTRVHLAAELDWMRQFLVRVQSGEY